MEDSNSNLLWLQSREGDLPATLESRFRHPIAIVHAIAHWSESNCYKRRRRIPRAPASRWFAVELVQTKLDRSTPTCHWNGVHILYDKETYDPMIEDTKAQDMDEMASTSVGTVAGAVIDSLVETCWQGTDQSHCSQRWRQVVAREMPVRKKVV